MTTPKQYQDATALAAHLATLTSRAIACGLTKTAGAIQEATHHAGYELAKLQAKLPKPKKTKKAKPTRQLRKGSVNCPDCKKGLHFEVLGGLRPVRSIYRGAVTTYYFNAECPSCHSTFHVNTDACK